MVTCCDEELPPTGVLRMTGFGVATRPVVPPLPTVRLIGKVSIPDIVVTVSVAVYVPAVRFAPLILTLRVVPPQQSTISQDCPTAEFVKPVTCVGDPLNEKVTV